MASVVIRGAEVPLSCDSHLDEKVFADVKAAAAPFQQWLASLEGEDKLKVVSVHIQSVDYFGPRVGFVKFRADVENEEGRKLPGIVFMRGGAVGILIVVECNGESHVILTNQPRVPIGARSFPELPAGMLDGSGNFKGVAAQEIAEECHLEIKASELVDLTELAYGGRFNGMVPSAGGCDEFIRLFYYKTRMEEEELASLQNRLTGLLDHGEVIRLSLVQLNNLWQATPDAKALSALALYRSLHEAGKLEQYFRDGE